MTPAPEMITAAGQALYGAYWRSRFEYDFSISARKLRRILKGEETMGAEMWGRVCAVMRERQEMISDCLSEARVRETAIKDARDHGMTVDEAWESCDLDLVEQVAQ